MARLNRLPWRVLAGVLLAVAGLALGWLWFRDSSFAAVERVTITGSGSSERDQVRAALETTATGMSTLRVDERALEHAVEPFASVAGLRIRPDFPHDLRIEVVEHEPVATVRDRRQQRARDRRRAAARRRARRRPALRHDQGAARPAAT